MAAKRSITQFECSKIYCLLLLPLLLSLLIWTPSISFAATNPDDGKQEKATILLLDLLFHLTEFQELSFEICVHIAFQIFLTQFF